jgi:hypothetical protein
MSQLDTDLARIGDQLQTAWRADARRSRRRHGALVGVALSALLVVAGVAVAASGVLPIHLTPREGKPTPKALVQLRGLLAGPPSTRPKRWRDAPKALLRKAYVIAEMTGGEQGRLSVLIVPVAPRGACLDAARPDGSSFIAACASGPLLRRERRGGRSVYSRYYQLTAGVEGPLYQPLNISLRSAPVGAATVDVRARDGSRLPAVLNHGWLVFVNEHPGPAVLVRFYDGTGRRILSYYGS